MWDREVPLAQEELRLADETFVQCGASGGCDRGSCGGDGALGVSGDDEITTIAGNGKFALGGVSGDGGPATGATISGPFELPIDAAGNIYIADSGSVRVRKVYAAGIIATVAGGGSGDLSPALPADRVAIDPQADLYISEHNRRRDCDDQAPALRDGQGDLRFSRAGAWAS